MATREERIIALQAKIDKRERERDELPADDLQSRLILSRELAVYNERLLLMEQQRKFASHISIILFNS